MKNQIERAEPSRGAPEAKPEFNRCPDCDKPLEPCGSCPQCGEYPDSPCHKAYLAWPGWNGPAPMWDTFRAGWQARESSGHVVLLEACKGLLEELRLIRMKDTNAVYDPTIRVRAEAAIQQA